MFDQYIPEHRKVQARKDARVWAEQIRSRGTWYRRWMMFCILGSIVWIAACLVMTEVRIKLSRMF